MTPWNLSNADVQIRIEGLQQAQAKNRNRIAALEPDGILGQEIKRLALGAHRYAIYVTHVDTGTLRRAHRMAWEEKGPRAMIYLSPSATNWRSGRRAWVYGPYEHNRGGTHAFYDRTMDEYAKPAMARSKAKVARALLYGSK